MNVTVRVLGSNLANDDVDRLEAACGRHRLTFGDGEAPSPGWTLAEFHGHRGDILPPPAGGDGDAYPVLVSASTSADLVFRAFSSGYRLVLPSPLSPQRLDQLLRYLSGYASPPSARVLDVDATGLLTVTGDRLELTGAQREVLALLGKRPGGVVSRQDLATAVGGEDPQAVIRSLRERFELAGSGAQILKVPHIGFRLAGSVRSTRSPA